jgi:hypothetical protein
MGMEQHELEHLSQVFEDMRDLELAVAAFYQGCSDRWEERRSFWMDMEYAEIKHADNVKRMSEILLERPEKFESGSYVPSPDVLKTLVSAIRTDVERIKRQEMDEKKVLSLSVALERTFLEGRYGEVVKTSDPEFNSLLREINADTVFHREYLAGKLNEWAA